MATGSKGQKRPAECIGARKERIEGSPDPDHVLWPIMVPWYLIYFFPFLAQPLGAFERVEVADAAIKQLT